MFQSVLSKEMESFLALRDGMYSPQNLDQTRRSLRLLDQYLCDNDIDDANLTEDILNGWIKSLSGKSKTIKEKVGAIRIFIKYLNAKGYTCFLPDAIHAKTDYIPYIYTDDEVRKIFYYADNLEGKNQSDSRKNFQLTIPMILRIMYGCGTRLGETVSLKRRDIDFENRTIFLSHSKFNKERLIPVHDTLMEILQHYCLAMGVLHEPDTYVFPGRKSGTHLCKRQVAKWFSDILAAAGVDQEGRPSGERGACLHCFRHLFVMKSMLQMESAGHPVDVNDLMLPTYLGHEHLLDTDKYMRFSGVRVPEAIELFESYSAGLFPETEVPYEEE